MSKYFSTKKRRGVWLIVLGFLLTAYSMTMLLLLPPLSQYISPSPAETGTELKELITQWDEQRAELGEGAKCGMCAIKHETSFDAGGEASSTGYLLCAGLGYFDASPRYLLEGRLFTEDEYKYGAKLIVIDKQLSFTLFPTTEALGAIVHVDGVDYTVIGVVRHKAAPGDSETSGAYIPLNAVANAGIQTDYVQFECLSKSDGQARALESVSSAIMPDGNFYRLDKEVSRVTMLLRIAFIVFMLYAIGRCLGAWNKITVHLINGWREEVLHRYFKNMLPSVILRSVLQLLGYLAIIAAAAGVLSLIIRPMYVFTEWIPEIIVEWNKIEARVTQLLLTAANPVKYVTSEYCTVRFYGALNRWGAVLTLLGLTIFKLWAWETPRVKDNKK